MKQTAYRTGGHVGRKVIISILVYLILLAAGTALLATLILGGRIGEERIGIISLVLLYGATVMGAVIASVGEENWWLPLAAFAAIGYILLLAINILLFDGAMERIGIGSLAMFLGALTAAGLKFLPVAAPAKKRFKYRFR